MSHRLREAALLFALSGAAPLLCAADPGPDARLPEVTSEGHEEPAQSPAAKDPTAFATSVPRRSGESARASELVQASPSAVVRDFGVNQPATVSLRGSTSDQVTVLLDGVPLNPAAGGGADLSTIPLPLVDRISVVRGAVGAHYGAGAVGGVVALQTRRPEDGARDVFGELSYGSFETAQGSAGLALPLGQRASALVTAFALGSKGDFSYPFVARPLTAPDEVTWMERANNTARRAGGLARVSWSGPVEGDVLFEADGGERGVPGPLNALSLAQREDDLRGFGSARAAFSAGGLRFEARAGARLSRLHYGTWDDPGSPQDETLAFGEASALKLWGRHAIELGLTGGRESLASEYHGAHARGQFGAYLDDEMTFSFLTALPALRYERIGDLNGLSPKLGLSAPIGEQVAIKANVGRSFRAPSFGELYLEQGSFAPNPQLKPETGTYVDLGPELHVGPVAATAAGFFARYDDLILYELYPGMRAKPYNVGSADVWGGELEASAAYGYFSLAACYTLSYSANRMDDPRYQGHELPYHPRHRGHARAAFTYGRFEAHLDGDAQSELYLNRTTTSTAMLPGRARFDAGASFAIDRDAGLSLNAEVKNLTNSWDQDLYGYPLPGRAAYLSVRFDSSNRSTP